jgi:cytochrome c-type biogenesis protein CcmE
MNPIRKKRIILISAMVIGVGSAVGFALFAFNQNLMFYFSPTEVAQGKVTGESRFRLGGIVVEGTVKRASQGVLVSFDLTDGANTVKVEYDGILPDLFREGQVILAKGQLGDNKKFVADEVLAKHDENYMPPEVAESLKKAGQAMKQKPPHPTGVAK